jgi:glycine/D-amino acid oxidase-like deaminating enzyme
MQGAPLLESRVCQYTDTPDEHFIIDRHPRAENCWILGGGSGHGFKHGPAIGEYVAGIIAGQVPEIAEFSLDRDYPKQKQGD